MKKMKSFNCLTKYVLLSLGLFCSINLFGQFELCNTSSSNISVAIGYHENGIWVSEGWFNIARNDCRTIMNINKLSLIKNNNFYLHATGKEFGYSWKGDYAFCVQDAAFSIKNNDDVSCSYGQDRAYFFHVKRNEKSKLTYTFSDNSKSKSFARLFLESFFNNDNSGCRKVTCLYCEGKKPSLNCIHDCGCDYCDGRGYNCE